MKRVLIVDDEEDLTWSIEQHLKKDSRHYELHSVNSGQAALDLLSQVPIDLVVSDIRMPEISGLDLLIDIREKYPSTKVIIMTAYGSSEIQNEASERGCFQYIEKPFEISELRRLIMAGVEDQKGFDGRVSDFQLSDLIQMNCLGRLTNALYIEKGMQRGMIYIEDGTITHSEVGNIQGEEAFYEIMSWEGGSFKVHRGEKSKKETILKGWQGLLIESLRLKDERRGEPKDRVDALRKREEELTEVLRQYNKNKGILLAEVVDSASISLARIKNNDVDDYKILPLVNALAELEAESFRRMNLNNLQSAVMEFEKALLSFSKLPGREEIFAVVATEDMNLGMIRMENKKIIKKLAKILDKYSLQLN